MLKRIKQPILEFSGIALIALAIVINWYASRRSSFDFFNFYLTGYGIASGSPIYDPEWQRMAFAEILDRRAELSRFSRSIFYPPATGIVTLPIALLPYWFAQIAWFAILNAAIIWGVRAIVKLASPTATRGVWLLAAGVVLISSCTRWSMTQLHGPPLVFALLAFLLVALYKDRPVVAFVVVTVATAFKFTMALPFFGLLLLHKRYGVLIGSLAFAGTLNLIGFARVGGLSAVKDYSAQAQILESIGTVNSPSPWDRQSAPRLDWPYLLNGLTGYLPLSRILALILFVACCVWLFRKNLQIPRPLSLDVSAAFLISMVCLGVLCVYHHHYDIVPLLVPLLVVFVRFREFEPYQNRLALKLMMPLIAMIALLPVAISDRIAVAILGDLGFGLLNMTYSVATTLMLISSLIIIQRIAINAHRDDRTSHQARV